RYRAGREDDPASLDDQTLHGKDRTMCSKHRPSCSFWPLAAAYCSDRSKDKVASWGCKPESQKFPSWAGSQYWCGLTPNSYFPAATSPSRKLFD
ncbi:hypothetical protein, partial [Pseudomonas syringae group genomosp. 3]